MTVPVLTAVTDAVWEADLVAALERMDLGVAVVRRCVDLADLLAAAAAGTARAAILSADLRRLDRDALSRLASARVAVVGLVPPGDGDAERRMRQLGLRHVLPADSPPDVISAAVVDAVSAAAPAGLGAPGDVSAALPDLPDAPVETALAHTGTGRVLAVWGPTGAPGRTTVAVALATELAAIATPTLLVDADVYGGVIAQVLGLLDESPGLAAAARLANAGELDLRGLARLARSVGPHLSVLTGIARAERWTELRPASMEVVLEMARGVADITVVDCGFSLEQDEELAYDTTAPRRNGATLAVLAAAHTVVVVGSADPVGLQRLVRGLAQLKELLPAQVPYVMVNRVRGVVVPGSPEQEVRAALDRYAGVSPSAFVPFDQVALDQALANGRSLAETAPAAPIRLALAGAAADLVGAARPAPLRRRMFSRLR
ncbi:MAG: chromosome partitioning protein [Actinomycetota bacterium]|nr:chromosome partitioning protein [Actinomycetota bacterium]